MPLSASSAASLRAVIDQSLAAPPAPPLGGAVAPVNFCSIWPGAKPILQALVPVVSAIPGIGATAGPVLTALISVGDAIYQQTCAPTAGAAPGPSAAQNEARTIIESSLASSSAPLGGASPTTNFCTIWPQAKPILQLLAGIVTFIPGVGAAAGPILTSLIAVGDSIYQQTCQAQ
jgi:hypothetical protein